MLTPNNENTDHWMNVNSGRGNHALVELVGHKGAEKHLAPCGMIPITFVVEARCTRFNGDGSLSRWSDWKANRLSNTSRWQMFCLPAVPPTIFLMVFRRSLSENDPLSLSLPHKSCRWRKNGRLGPAGRVNPVASHIRMMRSIDGQPVNSTEMNPAGCLPLAGARAEPQWASGRQVEGCSGPGKSPPAW